MNLKLIFKKIIKSQFVQKILSVLIFIYMHFIHLTSKITYEFPSDLTPKDLSDLRNTILMSWHDTIMILPHISPFNFYKNVHALVSPHNDGRIISDTMKLIGYNIIEGSSNRNSLHAAKKILKILKSNGSVVITPDGPRGPRHEMKGNILEFAKKCNSQIIPMNAYCSKYVTLSSWDKLIFPFPFGRITVTFGNPIFADSDIKLQALAKALNKIGRR